MSKFDDVLKLAKKQDYIILLDKDGGRKFCVVPVDKKHIPDMTQRLEDQLKAEGKLGYYVGMIMPVSWEPCMDFLPVYGRTDKYETKWLRRNIEDAISDELKDRGSELYKRIMAYKPNVTIINSKSESFKKLHIKEDAFPKLRIAGYAGDEDIVKEDFDDLDGYEEDESEGSVSIEVDGDIARDYGPSFLQELIEDRLSGPITIYNVEIGDNLTTIYFEIDPSVYTLEEVQYAIERAVKNIIEE